jgi:hypothetical protein
MRHPEIGRTGYRDQRLPALFADAALLCESAWNKDPCESAWNKDPVFGVIGIQSGPPRRRVHSGFRGGCGGQVGDAGSGGDCEDPSGVFRAEQTDQDDLPRSSGVAESRAQGDPIGGDRVSLRAGRQPLPRIDPWRDQLDGLLLENEGKSAREQILTALDQGI